MKYYLLLFLLYAKILMGGNIISYHEELPRYWTIKFKRNNEQYVARIPYEDSIRKLNSYCLLSKINIHNDYNIETNVGISCNFPGPESVIFVLQNSNDIVNFNLAHERKSITWNNYPITSFSATLNVASFGRKD